MPNRANRYHVEFTLKKFLLPKVVAMFCQRRLFTEILMGKGLPENFGSEYPEEGLVLNQAQKDVFLERVQSVLTEIDKIWPMYPSIDEIADVFLQRQTAAAGPHSASPTDAALQPPVSNAFQVLGRAPARMLQHAQAAGQEQRGEDQEALKSFWIRPWDSVFDRKKNGFGTFFAKEVLELCHCDETTISCILGISMRHIAVKKSEMVLPPPQPSPCFSHSPPGIQKVNQCVLSCRQCIPGHCRPPHQTQPRRSLCS